MGIANYELLASLFAHPGAEYEADLARAIKFCEGEYPAAAEALHKFSKLLPTGKLAQQELHTRTFDVQAITSLDIGYTLFGEDYKRGALLANLSAEHERAENDCGAELGDNLSNVLRLLPKLVDLTLREEFVRVLLAPALREMICEFEPGRLAKKEEIYKKHHKTIIDVAGGETRTAYRHALEAVHLIVLADFGLKAGLPIERESRFAAGVGAEMHIADDGPHAEK